MYEEVSGIILAKNFLSTIGLSFWYGTGKDMIWFGEDLDELPGRNAHGPGKKFHIEDLLLYIQDLEVVKSDTYDYLDYVFRFTAPKAGTVYIPGSKQQDCSETQTTMKMNEK